MSLFENEQGREDEKAVAGINLEKLPLIHQGIIALKNQCVYGQGSSEILWNM